MENEVTTRTVTASEVQKAVKFSCIQAMTGAIYAASTGGMFLVGYALLLGADDVKIGLLTTVPLCMVVFQLLAAYFVEKGANRKTMTIVAQAINVLCWLSIALTPWLLPETSNSFRLTFLIVAVGILTAVAHLASNARASWVGDLIPASERGSFFGKMVMYGGVIGIIFALVEGKFLDVFSSAGPTTFSWVFLLGIVFGIVTTWLFLPQADVKIEKPSEQTNFSKYIKEAFSNRALLMVSLFGVVFSLQTIAAPFYATYMLRDLKMPFIGVGILTASSSLVLIASSSFWGRMLNVYGCRPVLVLCCSVMAPTYLAWTLVTSSATAYGLIVPINLFQGFWGAGIAVGMSTLVYKVTPTRGRAVQLAVYSVIMVLCAAPMPTVGGYLPRWISALGFPVDLRVTFASVAVIMFTAAIVAKYIPEDGASTPKLVLQDVAQRCLSLLPKKMP